MTKTTNQKRFENWLASLETESNYKKFLTKDMIRKLLSLKDEKLEKQEYPKTIIDPLSLALEFYKEQSDDYKRIIEGIQSGQIISLEKGKSYIDT